MSMNDIICRDSSVNDSGVVGDHDQDSLYDLTIANMDIINCKEKERKPSKIDIPFVVSIGNNLLRIILLC